MKNKVNVNIAQQLRQKKNKHPQTYWKIIKGDQSNKENGIVLGKFYDNFFYIFIDTSIIFLDGVFTG